MGKCDRHAGLYDNTDCWGCQTEVTSIKQGEEEGLKLSVLRAEGHNLHRGVLREATVDAFISQGRLTCARKARLYRTASSARAGGEQRSTLLPNNQGGDDDVTSRRAIHSRASACGKHAWCFFAQQQAVHVQINLHSASHSSVICQLGPGSGYCTVQAAIHCYCGAAYPADCCLSPALESLNRCTALPIAAAPCPTAFLVRCCCSSDSSTYISTVDTY